MARKYMNNDITLIVSGEKFMANKAIIAEKSDYFKAMFSSGMLESKTNQVEINGISSKGFVDILRFMNGLVLEICLENVLDILAIADYILINDAVKLCEEFLISNVDAKNCNTVANIAECYSFVGLKEHVLNFIDENFWHITQTEFFYELTPEQIHHAVTADKIVNFSELDFLEAILQWGLKPSNLTIEEKLKHVEDILGHVRFYEISKKELNERLKIIFSENSSIHPIHEKIMQLSMLPCNSLRTKFSTRGLQKAILKVGAFEMYRTEKSLAFNFINHTKWIKLTNIPNPYNIDRFGTLYRSLVLNNELYLVANNMLVEESPNSFVWKFSHKTNNWETIDPMNIRRDYFSLCEVDDKIYAVGGSDRDWEPINIAECYDPMMKTWESIARLPQPRCHHASVNFKNILYISGGFINEGPLYDDCMLKYNPLTNIWLSCSPLLSPRFGHTMITYGDKIYVWGGWRTVGVTIMDIEEYDVANDSWRFVTNVPVPGFVSAILVESKIYILGTNYYYDNEFYEIDCYDLETNEWSKELKEWSKEVNSTSCEHDEYHIMYLPKSLADDFS